ncbi:MAG TPA: HAD family phosphatase [Micromonosporaceae bacterium]|nr:HAD family phosphatase [Micromonosporaceae bacterium]
MDQGNGLSAVLFDMDGTLVDSEKTWTLALDELAARYGGTLSREARVAMVGTTTDETMAILHTDLGQPWRDPDEGAHWLDNRVKQLFATDLSFLPGAQELLRGVRAAGIPTALVTATAGHIVEVMLGVIGRENFDVIVTDDEVTYGKPHPEPYATAAAILGTEPARCVAIEDSPNGIASARAAGCVVVGVPAEVDLRHVPGITLVRSLADVDVAMLRRLVVAAASISR